MARSTVKWWCFALLFTFLCVNVIESGRNSSSGFTSWSRPTPARKPNSTYDHGSSDRIRLSYGHDTVQHVPSRSKPSAPSYSEVANKNFGWNVGGQAPAGGFNQPKPGAVPAPYPGTPNNQRFATQQHASNLGGPPPPYPGFGNQQHSHIGAQPPPYPGHQRHGAAGTGAIPPVGWNSGHANTETKNVGWNVGHSPSNTNNTNKKITWNFGWTRGGQAPAGGFNQPKPGAIPPPYPGTPNNQGFATQQHAPNLGGPPPPYPGLGNQQHSHIGAQPPPYPGHQPHGAPPNYYGQQNTGYNPQYPQQQYPTFGQSGGYGGYSSPGGYGGYGSRGGYGYNPYNASYGGSGGGYRSGYSGGHRQYARPYEYSTPKTPNQANIVHNFISTEEATMSMEYGNMTCVTVYNPDNLARWANKTLNKVKVYSNNTFPFGNGQFAANGTSPPVFNFTIVPGRILHYEPVSITCCGSGNQTLKIEKIANGESSSVNCLHYLSKVPFRSITFVPVNNTNINTTSTSNSTALNTTSTSNSTLNNNTALNSTNNTASASNTTNVNSTLNSTESSNPTPNTTDTVTTSHSTVIVTELPATTMAATKLVSDTQHSSSTSVPKM